MKGVLEFDLPDEQLEFERASRAHEYDLALSDIRTWLRNERKYTEREQWPDLDVVWGQFHDVLAEHGIEL